MACTLRAMDDPLPTDVEFRTKNTVSAAKFFTFHFIFITMVFDGTDEFNLPERPHQDQ